MDAEFDATANTQDEQVETILHADTWQGRLSGEYTEVKTRLEKLRTFLTERAKEISTKEYEMLARQLRAMKVYVQTLEERMLHHGIPFDANKSELASDLTPGEPVEIGGHDEDRDGPIPFNG